MTLIISSPHQKLHQYVLAVHLAWSFAGLHIPCRGSHPFGQCKALIGLPSPQMPPNNVAGQSKDELMSAAVSA